MNDWMRGDKAVAIVSEADSMRFGLPTLVLGREYTISHVTVYEHTGCTNNPDCPSYQGVWVEEHPPSNMDWMYCGCSFRKPINFTDLFRNMTADNIRKLEDA